MKIKLPPKISITELIELRMHFTIKNEQYEETARLRDILVKLKEANTKEEKEAILDTL